MHIKYLLAGILAWRRNSGNMSDEDDDIRTWTSFLSQADYKGRKDLKCSWLVFPLLEPSH